MRAQKMFQPDQGFGPAKWLPWLFGAALIYVILTLIPAAEHMVGKITAIVVIVVVTALRRQFSNWLFGRDD